MSLRSDVELVVGPDHVGAVRRWYALLIADAVAQGVAVALVVPWLRELLRGDAAASAPWLLALLAAVIASGMLHRAAALAGFTVALATLQAVHLRTGEALSRVPLGWFSAGRTGRVTRMVTHDVQMVTMVPAHLMGPIVSAVGTPLTILVVLAFYEWRLALVTAACLPVLLLAHRLSLSLSTRADEAVDLAGTAAAERVLEFARLQPLLRAGGALSPDHPLGTGPASLEAALRDSDRATRRQLTAMVAGSAVGALPIQAALTVLLAVGVQLALSGRVDVATLVAVLVLASRSTEPLSLLSGLSSVVRTARAAVARFTDLAHQPSLPEPTTGAAFTTGAAGVEFENVTFGYADDHRVLHDVSFSVPAGTTTAIVGPSGSGKTTLTRLVQRAWDVDSGTVRLSGADVRELRSADLTDRISVVFQDVHLFTGSLLDNIRFGRPDASDEEVFAVARRARVDEIAERLEHGWDAPVGEGGAALSGGERQRVSVARALLKNAPVVLLDEPTSSLDPVNEAAVSAGMDALTKDATVLVVAHRLHTIARADQVLVVDGGRVVERGTHAELLAAGGRYAVLHRERERAKGWRLAQG